MDSTYQPNFQVGKKFKTLNSDVGGGTLANWAVPLAIQRMHKANPGFFSGIDPSVYQKYLGQSSAQTGGYTGSGDGGPDVSGYDQQNYQPLPQELQDLFSGVSIQRRGAGGMKDGRTTAMYDAAGNLIHAGDPYKYDPAGDTWKSLGEMGLLAGAAFGGLGLAGAGPLSGLQGVMGGAGGIGASAAGHGAFLGEGIASGIGAWDAAAGLGGLGAGGSMAGAEALGAIGSEAGLGLGGATDGGIGTLASQATAPFTTYAGGPLPVGGGGTSMLGGLGDIGKYLGSSNGLLSLGGNLLSGYMQSRASGKASDALLQAGRESNALQKEMFDLIRGDYAPYREAGYDALGQIRNLLADPSAITQQADYKFGLDQGRNALENSASARGMTYSGAQAKALQQHGQDYAGSKLNESYNRLASIAGIGQQATGSTAQAGTQYGQSAGNTLQNMGNARASGYIGQGNAWGRAFGSILDDYQNNELLKQYPWLNPGD